MDVLLRVAALAAALVLPACSSTGGQEADRPAAATPPSAGASPGTAVAPAHLALGDSVAAGIGAEDPARGGYVAVLADLLSDRAGCAGAEDGGGTGCPVRVRNLAVPGATTGSLLLEQLPDAVEVLRQDDDVRLVTVTIGGNDVFVPVLRACAQSPRAPSCAAAVRTAVGQADAGVDRLLAELTGAAGAGTTVAVMTYYDPLAACRLAPLQPLAEQVLEGTAGQDGLNDVLRSRAAEHGAVVVETREALGSPDDFVGGPDCLHPSTRGHARIARLFADAVAG